MTELPKFDGNEIRSIIFQWLDQVAECDRNYFDTITPEVVRELKLAADKSSYLGRRFYANEAHRTEPCPTHKGVWSGLPFDVTPCGCDLTGWLPRFVDASSASIKAHCPDCLQPNKDVRGMIDYHHPAKHAKACGQYKQCRNRWHDEPV